MEHNKDQNIDVKIPVYPSMVVKYENDLPPLPLSLPSLPTEPQLILQEEDPLHPPNILQLPYICTTCSLPFFSKFELFQHNMANHIGKYFSSVQLSTLSNDQFDHCITNLLEETLDTFEKVGDKEKCSYCSNLFPGMHKARNHLVVKHRHIIKEKLVELQKSENDLPQTPHMKESIITSNDDTSIVAVRLAPR